jgi:short-subunit dehydrogenase involved in D-alanine esterification of teichoic acids
MARLAGKNILITGGNSGIGLAAAGGGKRPIQATKRESLLQRVAALC